MQSHKNEKRVNYDSDIDEFPTNHVTVRKSENVTITLKTVINMFNRNLPLIKANKEMHPFMRRNAWKKRFSSEENYNKNDEKNKLIQEIKKLQEECVMWQKKSKTDVQEIMKLKQQISTLEEECGKWQNMLKEAELNVNEYKKRNCLLQEIIKHHQKESDTMASHSNNCFHKDNTGILYWPITKYSMIKSAKIGGHYSVYSKEFSFGENGYMFLLEANLNGDVKLSWGTHLSVQLYLIAGLNDDNLHWPCHLMGIICIVDTSGKNQSYFKNFSSFIHYPGNKEVISFPCFIHQSALNHYLVNDTLTLFVMLYDINYCTSERNIFKC